MHACLRADEIVRLLACKLVAPEVKATAVSLVCCCKGFEDPVLDALWETQNELIPPLSAQVFVGGCLEGGSRSVRESPNSFYLVLI